MAWIVCAALCASLLAQPDSLVLESKRAKELMASGRFTEAIPIYEKLVRAVPGNPGLQLNLAMALHLAGQDERAIPLFEAVLKQQPNALPALMLLGASHLRTGNPAKAVPVLERAMTLAPEDLEGRSMLADALLMVNRPAAALPHLRKLAAAAPDNPRAWYALGRAYESVSQRAFEDLEKAGVDTPWWLTLVADVRLKQGRHTAAFALYQAALEKQRDFRGAAAGLVEVYRATGHGDWAAAEEQRVRQLGSPPCRNPSAECLFLKGEFGDALAYARRGKTAEAFYWQSRAANELARESFSHLTQLPPSAELHQTMAELYRNQGRHADAVEQWKAAIRLSPENPALEQELVTSIYMNHDYATAEGMARSLLARNPNLPELQFVLGDSLMNLQRPEQAIEPLRKAVALRDDYPAAQAVLGRALLQAGQAAEAIPHLKAALPLDTDGSLHFQLSRAYQSTGEPELARQMLQEYQRLRQAGEGVTVEIGPPK